MRLNFKTMLEMLYSHTRNIDTFVFPKKIIYRIPMYNDDPTTKILSIKKEFGVLHIEVEKNTS